MLCNAPAEPPAKNEATKDAAVKALAVNPNDPVALTNLGFVEYRLKHLGEAEIFLKKAVRADPDSARAWLTLGVVCYDQDKIDAALAALSQAVLLEPKNARAHNYLGVTIGRKGWYCGAESELRTAVELAPDYAEAHFNLALSYLQHAPPSVELARRHYQRALDLGAAPDELVEKQLAAPAAK
jgi:Flp pilus assembly protein TadD